MSEAKKMKPGHQRKMSDSGRKRNKKVVNAKFNKSRIYIGNEYDRWMEIKTALRLETKSEVAKILLDRYQRYYSKTGFQWSVYAKREDKDYHHVLTIIKSILQNRLQDPVGMNRKVLLDFNDPRIVSAVLAPTLPPSTADLVAQKISRFNKDKEDPDKTLDYSWTTS